ncbi:hypothetical protein [Abyssibacter sp.]|uniref:hypothetical protein n=1 Tax=Abyssibacter sp. TaxID=2320200 RepID=UPI003511CE98
MSKPPPSPAEHSPRTPRALRQKIAQRAPELERRAYARFARRSRWGFEVTRVLPILLGTSIGLWAFAPLDTMRLLTPYVGAAALICAGLYLFRVLARIGHFSNEHLARLPEPNRPSLIRLKRSLYKMASVLVGTLIMAGCYFVLSAMVLSEPRGASEPGLLWTLPIGGLVLSIFFGEAVTRLIEVVEETMEQIAASTPPASPED